MAKRLILKKLTILATTEKSGNQFIFGNGINLITSSKNSVGKSSLIKAILSAFGAEPFYDKKWKDLQCNYLIEFEVDSKKYSLARTKNEYYLSDGINYEYFENFKDITKRLSKLFNFNPILKVRGDEYIYEIAPPAYYFIHFYIDQIKGWGKSFSSLDKLGQYEYWHTPILEYHVGYTNSAIMNLRLKVSEYKNLNYLANEKNNKVTDSISVIKNLLSGETENFYDAKNLNVSFTDKNSIKNNQLNKCNTLSNTEELILIKGIYSDLLRERKDKYDNLTLIKENLIDLKNQENYINKNIKELQRDYYFAVENFDDTIECPVCGVKHNNSLENRADILLDADKLTNLLNDVIIEIQDKESLLTKTDESIRQIDNELFEYERKIDLLNNFDNTVNFYSNKIIEEKSQKFISSQIEAIGKNTIEITKLEEEVENLEKTIDKKSIDKYFKEIISLYSNKLNIPIPSKNVPNFKQYTKYEKNGGAADCARSLLMYYLALYSVINKFSDEVIPPLLIDTPNQQEQSLENYQKILDSLVNDLPPNTQLFLGAMEHPLLEKFKDLCSETIELHNSHKLVSNSNYDLYFNEMENYLSKFLI